MKSTRTRQFWVGAVFLGLVANVWGAPPEESPPGTDFEPLIVSQQVVPAFPARLRQRGVTGGEVRLLLRVDSTGRLFDKLVVAYTHREFADAVLAAVAQWSFEPALQQGDPVAAVGAFTVVFDAKQRARIDRLASGDVLSATSDFAYHAFAVSELDRPPETRASPAPRRVSDENGAPLAGRVRVDYYIDENGRVRMPVVVTATSARLGWTASLAIEQWRYESPQRHGRHVLASASHVFDFEDPAPANLPVAPPDRQVSHGD